MSSQQEARLGQQIGEYRFVSKLGRGSFGTIYLAEHVHEQVQVAVKEIDVRLTKSEDFKDFINEARTIRLRHPHIVPLLDFGITRHGVPYLVMEYAPQGTLRDRHTKGERVEFFMITSYVDQLASALQYAHDRRVVHRDVKPENILVRADGTLMVSDFGIAKLLEQSALISQQTQAGTPAYMAPEQCRGYPCFASDQYALAVMVYEWLCGVRPFQGSVMSLAAQHMTTPPPRLRDHRPELPEAVESVVLKALEKAPEDRFERIQTFADVLHEALQQVLGIKVLTTPLETVKPISLGTVEPVPLPTTEPERQNRLPTMSAFSLQPCSLPQRWSRRVILITGSLLITGGITTWFAFAKGNFLSAPEDPTHPTVTFYPPSAQVSRQGTAKTQGIYLIKKGGIEKLDMQTGKSLWRIAYRFPQKVDTTNLEGSIVAEVLGDNLYILSDHRFSRLLVFKTDSGKMLWSSNYDVARISSSSGLFDEAHTERSIRPVLIDGLIYFSGSRVDTNKEDIVKGQDILYALDPANGAIKASYKAPQSGWHGLVILNHLLFYTVYTSVERKLYALHLPSGKVLWQRAGSSEQMANVNERNVLWYKPSSSAVPPDASNGILFSNVSKDELTASEIQTGKILWRQTVLNLDILAYAEEMVYAAVKGGKVFGLDIHTGKQVWMRQYDASNLLATPETLYLSYVITGTPHRAGLAALSAQDGAVRWQRDLPSVAWFSNGLSLHLINGILLIEAFLGDNVQVAKTRLYALKADDGVPLWDNPLNDYVALRGNDEEAILNIVV